MTAKTVSPLRSKRSSNLKARFAALWVSVMLCAAPFGVAQAQNMGQIVSPVLIIDREAVFEDTLFGQRVTAELEAESNALADETRKIEAALEEEERRLTAQRQTLSKEEFRVLADAFDDKVVGLRQDRDQAQQSFVQRFENAQRDFFAQIIPLLGEMMSERRAVVVMDARSVLLSVNAIDITEDAIALIDARLGDGSTSAPDDGGQDATDAPVSDQ